LIVALKAKYCFIDLAKSGRLFILSSQRRQRTIIENDIGNMSSFPA
jgi:hypothetical protein